MADSGASHCFICTEKIVIYSTGPCNHPICHLCSLRLRALYKTNECSSCRAPQLKVLFSSTSKAFSEDALASCPKQDAKLGIFFETADIASKVLRILRFNCPSCRAVCSNGWTELKAHVTKIHNKVICDICSKHKKVFTHELSLYTESGLVEHLNRGDKNDPSFKGHPYCGFCATHYYSKDELFEHCRQAHETCFICKRRGVLDVYYQNYARLEEHFRSDHYFCTEKACLDKKFVVFETDIDLRAHDVEEHPGKVKRGKSTPIELNFQYGPGSSHSAGGSRESGNRGGNGDGRRNGGGRSQQQQSSHQLHQTRVSEPRAASPFMQRTSSSSSLHDASLGLEEGPSQGEAAARFVPASEPSVRDRVARKAPPGFGAGLTKEPSKESVRASSSQPQTPPSGAAQKPIAPPAVSGDPEVISRLQLLLSSSDSKFAEFKSLATSFKASILSADEFFQGLLSLCMDGKSNSLKMSIEKEVGQLWVRLADTLPVEETVRSNNKGKGKGVPLNGADGGKKQEMLKTWNNYRARNVVDEWGAKPAPPNYANLSSSSSRLNVMPPSNGAPKVLVIKAKVKAQPKSSNGKPASSAAWNFKGSSSGPGLRTLSGGVRAAPSPCASIPTTSNNPSFHRSNAAPPTAWANSSAMSDITRSVSGMQVDSAFPGLPTPQRRSNNGSSSASPWAHAASSSGGVALPDEWEIEDSDNTGKRKKKGKKVLMHFG